VGLASTLDPPYGYGIQLKSGSYFPNVAWRSLGARRALSRKRRTQIVADLHERKSCAAKARTSAETFDCFQSRALDFRRMM
jgi:hypothetical protein